ncbi:putative nucleotidyltransferase [Enhygromyxa salina]|uniref:Putative nucleotidyltransferase n=1 Tax=Enhygromyxa salina TaxID=215803 RepID=A0A2S9XIZ6_9BACT|nr:nucleotidyltransferase domain-containing protein [Enhygromyxa salina]PRP92849.1 putative nucleotidyltransferase [Enhygromyxa salina]
MQFDVDTHTIFLGLSGSHAYGTARAGSDVDLRGCCVAPLRTRLSFRTKFEQFTWVPKSASAEPPLGATYARALTRAGEHPSAGPSLRARTAPPDLVIFDLAKVVALCAQCNPNMLELLFLDEREIVFSTPLWDRLRSQRNAFLSQKVRFTFAGYAQGQLRRIQGHREWLLHPPDHEPTRGEFGLPEQSLLSADERNRIEESIAKVVRGWTVDEGIELPGAERDVLRERLREFWSTVLTARPGGQLDEQVAEVAGASLGLGAEVLRTLRQERRYRGARKRWTQFQRWQRERNPKRAALEAAHGYDTKHGMHLIRLLRMGLEILRDGEVHVRRDDAEELLAIRRGELSYDALLAEAEALDQAMRAALETTSLPREVDEAALDELLFELLRDASQGED